MWQQNLNLLLLLKRNSVLQTKLVTNSNNTNSITEEIRLNGQRLVSFKYLGSAVTDEGSTLEIIISIAQTNSSADKTKTDME